MNIKSHFLHFSIFLIQIGFNNNILSQELFLKMTPNLYTSFGTYYQHISKSDDNTIEVIPISNLGNITWTNLNFGLQIDFLRLNNKIDLGFFVSNVSSQNGYKVLYFSTPTDFPNINKTSIFDYQLKTSYSRIDLGLAMRYNLDRNFQNLRTWSHDLTIQTMISKNRSTSSNNTFNGETMVDGNIFYSDSVNNNTQNKLGLAINLRYEWGLMSKNKNRNIISFIIGYRQGFTITNRSIFSVWHSNGMYVTVTSLSKSSAFFLGVTKPINFIKNN